MHGQQQSSPPDAARQVFLAAEIAAWKMAAQYRLNEESDIAARQGFFIVESVDSGDIATLQLMAAGGYPWDSRRSDQT